MGAPRIGKHYHQFEDIEFYKVNKLFIADWRLPQFYPNKEAEKKLEALVRKRCAENVVWGAKDPVMCLLHTPYLILLKKPVVFINKVRHLL